MHSRKTTSKSIFVSSTFRDMKSERDAIRDFVIPSVNEFASKYGRAVEIIDLRWGVDTTSLSEAEQSRKVLRTSPSLSSALKHPVVGPSGIRNKVDDVPFCGLVPP